MKHRSLKRMIGVLLAAALVLGTLCGCSGRGSGGQDGSTQGGEAKAMGRFLEENVDIGVVFSDIYDVKKLEDGTIRIIGTDEQEKKSGVWDSKDDGKTWEKAYDIPAEAQGEYDGFMLNVALSPEGQAVCEFDEILYLIDKDGKADRIPFELLEAEEDDSDMSNGIYEMQFPDNDEIVLQDHAGTVYQVNVSDGNVKHTYQLGTMASDYKIFAVGNTMVAQGVSEVLLYDLETGEQKSSEEALDKGSAEYGYFSAVDTLDAEEGIYCLSRGGLYHYKFGGSVMEELIDGNMNSLGAPEFYPVALTMIDEQNLFVVANDIDSDSIASTEVLKYTYSADTPAKPDKELKVYSLYDNTEIRQSVNRFRKEHGDVYVNYQVAMSDDNGVTVSDALKTLTTEIMAGNGPDVLLLDDMPVEAYVEKGVLKDLTPLLEESGGSYFENIINAYQSDQGQRCAVPARFLIPAIYADSAYYTPGEDFNAFTERKDTMANIEPWEVVQKFWYTCGAAWQKDDKTLDEAKITEFLRGLKNAYGEYDKSMEDRNDWWTPRSTTQTIEDTTLDGGDYNFIDGRVNTNFGLCRRMEYGLRQAIIDEMLDDGKRGLMPGQADHVFVPCMVMGISSRSGQQEAAEEFVKYLFSQESQEVSTAGGMPVAGFPVEKEAFHSFIDGHQYEKEEAEVYEVYLTDDIKYVEAPLPEKAITAMTELVESLTTPALRDQVIMDVVVEQGEKVLKGEISPEEGTAAIMQKVNIYLAE